MATTIEIDTDLTLVIGTPCNHWYSPRFFWVAFSLHHEEGGSAFGMALVEIDEDAHRVHQFSIGGPCFAYGIVAGSFAAVAQAIRAEVWANRYVPFTFRAV